LTDITAASDQDSRHLTVDTSLLRGAPGRCIRHGGARLGWVVA
jgi:hypothetical protein